MLTIRSLFGHVQVFFTLFANFAFAAPQNVTVDDAALTGPVTITYLPSPSNWSQGNNCSGCIAKPDPSQAYNGTWHDTTYIPNSAVYQAFQFNFTGTFLDPVSLFLDLITLFTIGSGLYIFFILANTVTGARMSTSVNFILDGVPASSFTHNATTSTSYEYNQTVFANSSIPNGLHTMKVEPVNNSVNVLILFDYLIYTCVPCLLTFRPSSSAPLLARIRALPLQPL